MTAPSQTRSLAVVAFAGLTFLAVSERFRREPPPADVHFPRPKGLLPGGKIEINLADTLAWQTIKGVGPARAKTVVRRREKRGYFDSPDDLCEIRGLDSLYDAQPEKFVVSDSILKIFRDSLGEPKPLRPQRFKRKTNGDFFRPSNDDAPRRYPESIPRREVRVLDLNAANEAELEALPGIGEVLSARIVKFRNLLGGFYSVEQLREVYGIRDEHYQKCAPLLAVQSPPFRRVAVNSAPVAVLKRHPYFKSYADSIVAIRPLNAEKLRALMKADFARAEAYVDWR